MIRRTSLVVVLALAVPEAWAQGAQPTPEFGSQPPPGAMPGLPPAGASDEIADPRTGCAVVSATMTPGTGIAWSGGCNEYGLAQGRGILQWTKEGRPTDRYEGEMQDGLYEGHGILTFANGARYEGDFRAGERDGRGTYVFPNGNRYVGDFRWGRPSGRGTYIWANGNRYIGEFRDDQRTGRGTLLYADGGRYEGDFVNGKAQGRGVRIWSNGTRYDGEWSNDRADGYGTKMGPDGRTFRGIWSNGCFRQGKEWATVGATARACGFE